MVNSVFQSEMAVSYGRMMIDCDFLGYDNVDILNRKHVVCSIAPSNNSIMPLSLVPSENVVMGFQHTLKRTNYDQTVGYTTLHLRRGR